MVHRSRQSTLTITFAFTLAIFACVVGLARCFVQSPQAQAASYLAISTLTLQENPALATSAAWEAARLNPASAQAWEVLALTLQQKGDQTAARQARQMASRLSKKPGDTAPLYAMPAELQLGFLASAGGEL